MRMNLRAALAALFTLMLIGAVRAQPAPPGPVADSSYRLAGGERVMELSVEVPAPLD